MLGHHVQQDAFRHCDCQTIPSHGFPRLRVIMRVNLDAGRHLRSLLKGTLAQPQPCSVMPKSARARAKSRRDDCSRPGRAAQGRDRALVERFAGLLLNSQRALAGLRESLGDV